MPNPALKYDSDWDYHDANMTPEQKVMQRIEEDGDLRSEFVEWMLNRHPEAVEMILYDFADLHYIHNFAEQYAKEQDDIDGEAQAEKQGLL